VLFGYYKADERDPGSNLPGQVIFTCLSVDIVAHEVTHAIVHRIRKYFSEATSPDVFAWHEAFADLVALFHHFLFPEVVAEAVANSSTDLQEGSALLNLALEFGESTGRGAALRSAIGSPRTPDAFLAATEPHARGACFVAAVFDTYLDTYLRQIGDLRRLATGGTGVLPPGALPTDLVKRVTAEAIRNADRLLGMVVRAFEYLPVVDVTFGDVVRGIVTADRALFPDDAMHLRANLVEALRRRGIYPPSVSSLAEEALTWPGPADPALSLTRGAHRVDLAPLILQATQNLDLGGEASTMITGASGDPEVEGPETDAQAPKRITPANANSATAVALTEWGTYHAHELGLDPELPLELVGVHAVFVQASDLQPRPIVVAQFAQRHRELEDQSLPVGKRMAIRAGTTVIARVDGHVVHVVVKPLPLTRPGALAEPETFDGKPDAVRAFAESCNEIGAKRAKALQAWSDQVTSADALAAWIDQPSLLRMTFAGLHAAEELPVQKAVPHA
jgi:hypothetical protein